MRLSIVATLYQSGACLAEFHNRATAAAWRFAGEDYEIVLVNDGSPDDSLSKAIRITERDAHTVVVDLSRNFGHHRAMMTGLAHSRGDTIFLIDADLEEDPAWLGNFAGVIDETGADVAYGVQEIRKGDFFERWSGECFWRLFNTLTDLSLPANIVTARLMTRRYVDALLGHEEREVFMAGLWHITGFLQVAMPVKKLSLGPTTYTFRRRAALLINSITSFSNKPLIGIFYIGVFIFIFATAYTAYLLVNWLFLDKPLGGWTSIMASIWLLGGLLMSSVGVIGIYLSKIFSETKRRPYSIVRHVYRRQ